MLVQLKKALERNFQRTFLGATHRAAPVPLSPPVLLPRAPTTKASTSSFDTSSVLDLLVSPQVINPWVLFATLTNPYGFVFQVIYSHWAFAATCPYKRKKSRRGISQVRGSINNYQTNSS